MGVKILLCAHGRVGQTQLHIFLRRISQSEIRNSAAAESEGGQKFLPPQPSMREISTGILVFSVECREVVRHYLP